MFAATRKTDGTCGTFGTCGQRSGLPHLLVVPYASNHRDRLGHRVPAVPSPFVMLAKLSA